ncbi:MAG: hypothetical protein V3R84_08820 [Acidimicrobiia bacterium]
MNWAEALHSLRESINYPPEPDVSGEVLARITAAPVPWWRRPVVQLAAVTAAIVVLVVGLVPAAREEVASWLGIGGVTIETLPPPTAAPVTAPTSSSAPVSTAPPSTTAVPPLLPGAVESGLGEGLRLGQEIVSLTVEGAVGFRPLYPALEVPGRDYRLGQPDREFVDKGGRAWMLYGSQRGLPEMQLPGLGMIVTQFEADSSGILKQISAGDIEFIELGDGVLGLWLPGPHQLVLPDADGSAVDGRSAGNTLLWEQGGLTLRLESALSRDQAIAIAETFR